MKHDGSTRLIKKLLTGFHRFQNTGLPFHTQIGIDAAMICDKPYQAFRLVRVQLIANEMVSGVAEVLLNHSTVYTEVRSTHLINLVLRQHSPLLHIGSFKATRFATKTLPRLLYGFAPRTAVVAIRVTLPPSSALTDLYFCNVGGIIY